MDELRMLAVRFARDPTSALDRKGYCIMHNITEAELHQHEQGSYSLAKACPYRFFVYCNDRGLGITISEFRLAIVAL